MNAESEKGNLSASDLKTHRDLRHRILNLINTSVTIKTIDDVQQLAYQLLLTTVSVTGSDSVLPLCKTRANHITISPPKICRVDKYPSKTIRCSVVMC